jgi:caa(3)-type oxidase subunit IV
MAHDNKKQQHHHHHHIMPVPHALAVGGTLLFLTFVTVWVAGIDLGRLNFLVAFAVATLKASLVALFFMNLLYDRRENGAIFATSFLFLAIFIVLTATDLFFRGNVYVPKGALAASGPSKLKDPWVSRPELVAKGKETFVQLCATCHGTEGQGNGPAAAGLTPKPRNFTQADGWKNGRKVSQIFKTLREGLGGMPSFGTEPEDTRWALAHYVQSLGPKIEPDSTADLAKAGIDPTKAGGGAEEPKGVPVDLMIDRMAVSE